MLPEQPLHTGLTSVCRKGGGVERFHDKRGFKMESSLLVLHIGIEKFSMLNILYVLPGGELSETTVHLRDLLAAVDREAFQLHVWLMQNGPVRELFQAAGAETRVLSRQHFSVGADINLDGELQALRPDLVHIGDERLLRLGMDCKRAGFPVIWHVHPNGHLG
jgi:hypothetical protein